MKKLLKALFCFSAVLINFSAIAAESSSSSVAQIEAQNRLIEKQGQQIAQLQTQINQIKAGDAQIQKNRQAIQQLSKEEAAQATEVAQRTSEFPNNFSPSDNGEPQFLNALRERITIISSPYLGLRSSYDASDLIVNLPSMNEDLVLLQQRQDMETRALSLGLPYGARPLIMVSGDLLPQFVFGNSYQNTGVSQFTLSGAELDVQPISGTWAAGFLAFNFDNSTPTATGQSVSAVGNSRVYISRGFITIGNLNKIPFYLTAGQAYAPFGIYANSLVTTPLTQSVGRTVIRTAILGYSQYGIYAQAYGYNGDTYTANSNTINEVGTNVGYKNRFGYWNLDVGGGLISNLADSQTAQNTGNTTTDQFQGFGFNNSEQLQNRVPGADIHAELKYKRWNVNAEYISALKGYSPVDLTFNGHGATPRASHLELDYNRAFLNRPWTFALAYDHSWEALGYSLPEQSYFAVVSVSVWKDTIESIEFRHDINYSANSSATTQNSNANTPITPLGSNRNTITLQFGLYF